MLRLLGSSLAIALIAAAALVVGVAPLQAEDPPAAAETKDAPAAPETPDAPRTPKVPAAPKVPDMPKAPAASKAPEEQPDAPKAPTIPSRSNRLNVDDLLGAEPPAPATPETPAVPKAPARLDASDILGAPETPAAPAAPTSAKPAAGKAKAPSPPATPEPPKPPRKQGPNRVVRLEDVPIPPENFMYELDPIESSILLDLGKVEREPERKWSLQFSVGTGQTQVDDLAERTAVMENLGRDVFGQLNNSGAFSLPWSNVGTENPSNAFRVRGDIRYHVLPLLTLEAEVGRSEAIAFFTQPGYRFDERATVLDMSVGGLVTLPWRLWRFGFYAGGGAGLLRGTMTSQLFVPTFEGTPDYTVTRATGNSVQYNLKGGGEVYLTRFISLTIEGEWRQAEISDLKYDDGTTPWAPQEGEVPLVFVDYSVDLESQQLGPIADPTRPVTFDFSGVLVTTGLRYHF